MYYDDARAAMAADPELAASVNPLFDLCPACTPGLLIVPPVLIDVFHDDDCPRLGEAMRRTQ